MKKRDFYNYDNPKFAGLRDPMRRVMTAYGEAERYFALIKEITWAEFGMKALTNYIHALEHIQPDAVDGFKAIMAEQGLMVEYPSISELAEDFPDLDRVFEVCVGIIDETDAALRNFIRIIDAEHSEISALARKMENLQMQNSAERSFLLEAWSMWDNNPSYTSFDNWMSRNAPYIKSENVVAEEDDD